MTRATLYILLPLALVVALAFAALGVPQTLTRLIEAATLEGARQVLSIGPVASQEPIKVIGDNGAASSTPIPLTHLRIRASSPTSYKTGASSYCRSRWSSPSAAWSET
jgi:Potassium-transporting ATPase A subunit